MGLIVNDTVTLDSGLPVTGTYLSFNGGQLITIEYGVSCALKAIQQPPDPDTGIPGDPTANVSYTISGTYSLWANKDAKNKGLKPLQTFRVDYGLTKDQINQPPLDLLYQYVKTIYTSVEDDV
jgi:hypothetical protein